MSEELELLDKLANAKDGMLLWSEANKKDFVSNFKDRVVASRYILQQTATVALNTAVQKQYVGQKQQNKLTGEYVPSNNNSYYIRGSLLSADLRDKTTRIGGRDKGELDLIAQDRSKEILSTLPPLKTAVQVLSADLAKKIDARDKIVEKGKKLTDELVELSQPIAMAEIDQKMTIGDFRKMVKDVEKKRTKLVEEINDLTKDGLELDRFINKELYCGLPGLSDAVLAAITSMMEKAKALDQLGRRVGEQVMFGNSDAALDLLRRFEKDETVLSDDVKVELGTAMEKLKLAVAGKKKKLAAKK